MSDEIIKNFDKSLFLEGLGAKGGLIRALFWLIVVMVHNSLRRTRNTKLF